MLSQIEADELIHEEKSFEENNPIIMKAMKSLKIKRIINGNNSRNQFILNVDRGKIELSKIKYQVRNSKDNTVLLRIDTKGPRHQNPDGNFIECPHIHIYKEGYSDKWAYELNPEYFKDAENMASLLKDFLDYFNVKNIPVIIQEPELID